MLAARHGHDVVVVARSQDRLEALAERIRAEHVEAHVVAADLSMPDAPARIAEAVRQKGLEIEFLLNNAGFGSNGAFLDLPLQGEADMLEVNCSALMKLTHHFARPMRERGHGRILNIASTAAFQPGPYMATYYATKAFVLSFSEALTYELKPSGVTVTCFCPGATATEFSRRSGNEHSRLFQKQRPAKAEEVARAGYEAMMRGEDLAVHGVANWIAVAVGRFSPRAAVRAVAAALNSRSEVK